MSQNIQKINQNQPISQIIRDRLTKAGATFNCNDNISEYISEEELDQLQKEVQEKFQAVLESLVIDTDRDPNSKDTAKRVAKMLCKETFSGRYLPAPCVTSFPTGKYDQLYISGPIAIRSVCAHHHQNISGNCWIGVFPGEEVVGLSKFNRIVDHVASRPQIQEDLTVQIADEVEKMTQAKGVAVIIKAEHHCMLARGVKAHENDFTTSIVRGVLRENIDLKNEFFTLLSTMTGIKN